MTETSLPVIGNEIPLHWSAGALQLLGSVRIAAIRTGSMAYAVQTVAQILNAGPNSTITEHALRELLLQSGGPKTPDFDETNRRGPGYSPLYVEHTMEANAREEGVRNVAERHFTRFLMDNWSTETAVAGVSPEILHDYVTRVERGANWVREMIAASWHGFLDANTIIQGKDLWDILWLKETGQKRVTLWISSTLLDEFDRLRYYHGSKRVRKRTSAFGKWIAPRMAEAVNPRGPGVPVRHGVVLRVWTEAGLSEGHDHDHLASALAMRDFGIPISMVTQDLGLQARAFAANVPVLRLSDASLLKDEEGD